MKELLWIFRDIIKTDHTFGSGTIPDYDVRIKADDMSAKRQPPRRYHPQVLDSQSKWIDEGLASGKMEKTRSPWAHPILTVKRKDGRDRHCIDLRDVNSKSIYDSYPMKNAQELFASIKGYQFASLIDLADAYSHVNIHPDDRHRTAFIHPTRGHFQMTCLPYGLAGAPAWFQRAIDLILEGHPSARAYLDDILITSVSFIDHLRDLAALMIRLKEHDLHIKLSKSEFGASQLLYLGHILTKAGMGTDPKKVEAVVKLKPPRSKRGIRAFLGITGYYRRFIKDYARIAKPLVRLLKKSADFRWSDEQQSAFETLKTCLTTAPILAAPDFDKPFIVKTDACKLGLAGILCQLDNDGQEVVIEYYSRTCNDAERSYHATDLEGLAAFEAISHWDHFLSHSSFKLITDHSALRYLMSMKKPRHRIARIIARLMSYNMTIEHRAGATLTDCDGLSRVDDHDVDDPSLLPCSSHITEISSVSPLNDELLSNTSTSKPYHLPYTELKVADDCTVYSIDVSDKLELVQEENSPNAVSLPHAFDSMLRSAQKGDAFCSELAYYITHNCFSDSLPHHENKRVASLLTSHQVTLIDGVLFIRQRGPVHDRQIWKRFVPLALINKILTEFHETSMSGGHLGFKAVYKSISERFYWPGMSADIEHHVAKSCPTCFLNNSVGKQEQPVKPIVIGNEVNDTLAADLIGPLPETADGYRYALVIVDMYNKMKFAFPLKSTEGLEIARALLKLILRRGCFRKLLTDKAQNLVAGAVKHLVQLMKAQKITTTPYMPQTDGMTERANKSIKKMIRAFANKRRDDWSDYLDALMFCINNTYDPSIGEKPSFLEYGRDLCLAVDVLLPPVNSKKANSIDEFRTNLISALKNSMLIADDCLDIRRSSYDSTRTDGNSKLEFQVGELALLLDPRLDLKTFEPKYRGPYRVTSVSPDKRTYTLQKLGSSRALSYRWNVKYMRKMWDLRPSDTVLTEPEKEQLITELDKFVSDDDGCIEFNPTIDPDDFSASQSQCHRSSVTEPDFDNSLLNNPETSNMSKKKQSKSQEDVYEVEKIVNHRIRKGVDEFLVKWLGYDDNENTWEPLSNLDCPALVQEYWSDVRRLRPLPPFHDSAPGEAALAAALTAEVLPSNYFIAEPVSNSNIDWSPPAIGSHASELYLITESIESEQQ